jgi:hypothetical protein
MSNGYQGPVDKPGKMIGGSERFRMDYAKEDWLEGLKFKEESTRAESARAIEDERKLWWSVGLGLLGSLFGPVGTIIGAGVGKVVGDMGTVGGKQAEEYLVSTDVGKFEKQREFDLQEFNRNLETYDKGQLWTDIMDIGKVAMGTYKFSAKDLKDFNLFSWGGEHGETAPGAEFLEDAWKRLFPNKN